MTVIAWDGKTLVADKKAVRGDLMYRTTKIKKARSGELMGVCGAFNMGLQLFDWYDSGANKDKFPSCSGDDWARLVVIGTDLIIKTYEGKPFPIIVEEPFHAWGSGCSFALAAMKMGADAVRAVEIASELSPECGLGIDTLVLDDYEQGKDATNTEAPTTA